LDINGACSCFRTESPREEGPDDDKIVTSNPWGGKLEPDKTRMNYGPKRGTENCTAQRITKEGKCNGLSTGKCDISADVGFGWRSSGDHRATLRKGTKRWG